MQPLGIEAMTAHWEFTYGAGRASRSWPRALGFPFLAGNVRDTTWDEDVFPGEAIFERGGLKIAVIGQAFPYTPIANPRYLIPEWSFGIKEDGCASASTRRAPAAPISSCCCPTTASMSTASWQRASTAST